MFLLNSTNVGGRLKYVALNSQCGELDSGGSVVVTKFDVPDERAVDAEMMMYVGELGGWATAAAGAYDDGKQWFVVVQLAPSGALREAIELQLHASRRAHIGGEAETFTFDVGEMYGHAQESIEFGRYAESQVQQRAALTALARLPRTAIAQATIVELTGYEIADLALNYGNGCAFPGEEHSCVGDVVTDAVATWYDRGLGPKTRG